MNWYMKRYLQICVKYNNFNNIANSKEFDILIKDFYKIEGENKCRWLFDDFGKAWFYLIDNDKYWYHDDRKKQIFYNFHMLLVKELELIINA